MPARAMVRRIEMILPIITHYLCIDVMDEQASTDATSSMALLRILPFLTFPLRIVWPTVHSAYPHYVCPGPKCTQTLHWLEISLDTSAKMNADPYAP
jgi:hypothetical protein